MNNIISESNLTLSKFDINKLKSMNDPTFIDFVRKNADIIENIIINIPKNMFSKEQIHPEEIFSIITGVNICEGGDDDIDPTILRNYLIANN